jgi:DNA-binding transcriptional regulator YdaS (Cro superfamily)
MNLDTYLNQPGALSIARLRELIGVKSDNQIRQWRHGYAGRQPSPEYATAIEVATERMVPRWESRPEDWHRIWPELIGSEGAPSLPVQDQRKSDLGPAARGSKVEG